MAQSVIPGSVSGGQDGDADDFDVFGDLGMDAEFPELGDVFGDEAGRSLHQQPVMPYSVEYFGPKCFFAGAGGSGG